ncbi:hypothetical protein A1F94_008779 [Pyrenophora tritici-repentis]|nr:hypothetical protein A1F94_008779 [Pyrenophora tritici-repentis]
MAIDQLKKGAEVMMLSAELMRDRISSLEKANSAASERRRRSKGVYRSMEYSQRELERIYWLKMRLTSRLLMKSVKEERDQASASGLKGAALE